jgi:hypothetical protein
MPLSASDVRHKAPWVLVIKVAGRDALCVSAGLRNGAITAPLVIDQQMNGEIFPAWLEQFLIPTLSAGDIVFRHAGYA